MDFHQIETLSKVCFEREDLLFLGGHDAGLLVVADALLEEVGLPLQADVLHEVEGILRVVVILAAQFAQQSVRNEFDVSGEEKGGGG